jgi:nitrogen regulatory protein PII
MKFYLIVSTVKPACTDDVVDAAKAAGATGATVIPARGVGLHEASTFFGLTLEAQSDVILFLLTEPSVDPVLEAIRVAGEFQKPGTGIAFVIPVERAIGLESQMDRLQEGESGDSD